MNGSDTYLDVNNSHLRVTSGNVYASSFNLDQISIVTTSNTGSTINFLNDTKGFTSSSNIEVGTANLFVNTTTSRVGIGTNAPAHTLDVHGTANIGTITTTDINVTGNLTVLGTTTTLDTVNLRVKDPIIEIGKDNTASPVVDLGLILTRPATTSNVAIIFDETTDTLEIGYTQSNASDTDITMRAAATEPLSVNVNGTISGNGSGLTALNATNVTTGTLTAARIPVLDAAKITTGTLPVARGGTGATGSSTGTGGVVLSAAPAFTGDVTFDTDTLKIDSTNNRVGIGTNAPGAVLDIRSSGSDPSTPTVHIGDNSADHGDYGMVNLSRHGTSGGSKAHLAFIRAGHTVFSQGFVNNTNTFGFWASFTTVTNTPTMAFTSAGNVGIGATTPDYKLHVEDLTNPRIMLENTDTALALNQDIGSIIFKQNDNTGSTGTGIIGKIRMSSVIAPPAGTFYGESANMIFSVGNYANNNANTDALTIRGNGNVGIGTTSPQGALHVAGSSGSSNTSKALGIHMGVLSGGGESYAHMEIVCNNSNSGWIDFKNANTSGNGDFEERIRGGDGNLAFHTNKGQRMTIDASGNVGIGVTSPDNKLEVRGTIQASQSDVDHGMIIDKGGTVRRDYGSNGAGFHFTGGAIWPVNYAGNYINNAIEFGNSSYRWKTIWSNTALNTASDDRLKHNEEEVTDALGIINKLKLLKYDKTGEMLAADYNGDLAGISHIKELGFIAQSVLEIPELAFLVSVPGDPEDEIEPGLKRGVEPYGLDYQGINNILVQAVQELLAKNDALEARILALENA